MSIIGEQGQKKATYRGVSRKTTALPTPRDTRVHVDNDAWLSNGMQMFGQQAGDVVQDLKDHDARIDLNRAKGIKDAIAAETAEYDSELYENHDKEWRLNQKQKIRDKYLKDTNLRTDIHDFLASDLDAKWEVDEVNIAQRLKQKADKDQLLNTLSSAVQGENGVQVAIGEIGEYAQNEGHSLDYLYGQLFDVVVKSGRPDLAMDMKDNPHVPEKLRNELGRLMPTIEGMAEWEKKEFVLRTLPKANAIYKELVSGNNGRPVSLEKVEAALLQLPEVRAKANQPAVKAFFSRVESLYKEGQAITERNLGFMQQPWTFTHDDFVSASKEAADPNHWGTRLSSGQLVELYRQSGAHPPAQFFNSAFNRVAGVTKDSTLTDLVDLRQVISLTKARNFNIHSIVGDAKTAAYMDFIIKEYGDNLLSDNKDVAVRAALAVQAESQRFNDSAGYKQVNVAEADLETALNTVDDIDTTVLGLVNNNPDLNNGQSFAIKQDLHQYVNYRVSLDGGYTPETLSEYAKEWAQSRYFPVNGQLYPKKLSPTNDPEQFKRLAPYIEQGIEQVKKDILSLDVNKGLGIEPENIRHIFTNDGILFKTTTGAPLLTESKQGQRGGNPVIPYHRVSGRLATVLTTLTGKEQQAVADHKKEEAVRKGDILEGLSKDAFTKPKDAPPKEGFNADGNLAKAFYTPPT